MSVCGFTFSDSSYVIQAHVLGMYAPAFLTGHLISRYGVHSVLIAGALLTLASIGINLAGVDFVNFMSALLLLGVGWNFLFTRRHRAGHRNLYSRGEGEGAGLNDFIIWGTISVGAVAAGAVQHTVGWEAVNLVMAPLVIVVLAATLWLRIAAWRAARQPA